MRTKGKVSKVAVCKRCKGFVLASHIDYIDKETEKEFTELTNEGFDVRIETINRTKGRELSDYSTCSVKNCIKG